MSSRKYFILTLVIASILVFLVVIGMVVHSLPKNKVIFTDIDQYIQEDPTLAAKKTDPVYQANAPIELILFSNFTCTQCAKVQKNLFEIVQAHPETFRLVWKDFPNPSLDEESYYAAIAGRCAQEQDAFWQFFPYLTQYYRDLDAPVYEAVATELDLSERKFIRCFNNQETSNLVNENYQEALDFGLTGAPVLYIAGERYSGDFSSSHLEQILQPYLNE